MWENISAATLAFSTTSEILITLEILKSSFVNEDQAITWY